VVFVAVGESKAKVIHDMVDMGIDYPSFRVNPVNGKLYWLIDHAAGSLLNTQ
jgi:6-phosphogluconolactonase/glucosamine-6-phosphate isomerase/deaminase